MPTPNRRTIRLTERRTTALSREEYSTLASSPIALDLINDGTFSLLRSKNAQFGGRAFNKVGQALLEDGTRLVIGEKVRGSLRNLLDWALPSYLRELSAPSPVGEDSPILLVFAERFLSFLGEYLRHGRLKDYAYVPEHGSSPKGRIDIRGTTRLNSKGRVGVLAFQRAVLTADLLPNRLLALGLMAVERYAATESRAVHLRNSARALAPLLSDVSYFSLARAQYTVKTSAFDAVLKDERVAGALRSAINFARALVLHLGAWPEDVFSALPSSYFLDLESLFEDAVRRAVSESVDKDIKVVKGDRWNRPLFAAKPDIYIADPDIVIGNMIPPTIVADCKYKEIHLRNGVNFPQHDDVYQIHTHCSAFGCRNGILIYTGETFGCDLLGTTPDGIDIRCVTIRVVDIRTDIKRFLDMLRGDR